jgi:hypothetical protein
MVDIIYGDLYNIVYVVTLHLLNPGIPRYGGTKKKRG